MKKIIAIALSAVLALSLCACAGNGGILGGEKEEESKKVTASLLTEIVMTEKNSDGDNDTMKAVLEYDEDYNIIGAKIYQNDTLLMEATYDKDMNKPLVQQEYDEDGDKSGRWEYTYDADGNVLTEKHYSGDELQGEYRYTYNADGKVETEISILGDGDESWTKYTYDEHGNVLTEKSGSGEEEYSSSTYENTYDGSKLTEVKVYSNGELSEHTKYDADGNEIWYASYYNGTETNRAEYTYENSKLVKLVRYSAGEEIYKQLNTYNADGKLTERSITYSDGEIFRQVYTYNETGDVTGMKAYDGDELSGEYTLTYESVTVSKETAKKIAAVVSMLGI